jgi:hypothetical protein
MEQSIRPFKSLSENEIMVKAYHAIEKPSSETAIVLAEIGIRYAALSAKTESYKSALDEAKDTINWMWKHMKEADGQTLLQVDVFNRPANALHIIESVIENNSEDWKTFTTEQVQPKVNVIETWKDEKEPVPQVEEKVIAGVEITVRQKAEQWFKEEVDKIDDEERKKEVLLEDETYIGVWMQGYKAMEETTTRHGAVWVKASDFKYEVGIAYHAKDNKSKGAGMFNKNGAFIWGDGTVTWPEHRDDLLILDEGARKEDLAAMDDIIGFAEWIQENAVAQYEGDHLHSWRIFGPFADGKDYTIAQLWGKYQAIKRGNYP